MPAVHITSAMLRNPPPIPAGKAYLRLFDLQTGFMVEIRPKTITGYVRYKDERQRAREFKIGRYGDLTLDQMRRRAAEIRAQVHLGRDPRAEIEALRAIVTVAEFYASHYGPDKKDRLRGYKNSGPYERRIVERLGSKCLDEVTPWDVTEFKRWLRGQGLANGTVNRHLADLRSMFSLAIKWGAMPGSTNPAASPGMLPEEHRDVYLDKAQMQGLARALDEEPNRDAAAAIFVLMMTGARKSEVLNARWSDVDLDRGLLHVASERSKTGRRRHIPLSPVARQCLRIQLQRRKPGNDFVFPGGVEGRPLESVRRAWDRAKERAKLPADLRLHDLRHCLASALANAGVPLNEIGSVLGHSSPALMTTRYAHHAPERLIQTATVAAEAWDLLAFAGE